MTARSSVYMSLLFKRVTSTLAIVMCHCDSRARIRLCGGGRALRNVHFFNDGDGRDLHTFNSPGSGESSFECSTSAGVKAEMIVPSPILQEDA